MDICISKLTTHQASIQLYRVKTMVKARTHHACRRPAWLQQHSHNVQRQEEQARQGGELLYMQLIKYNLAQRKKLTDNLSAETIFLKLIE